MLTNIPIRDLGPAESIDVILDRMSLDGKSILDIGCGGLGFTRKLVQAGAWVTGVDPDPVQADLNRQSLNDNPVERLTFIESPGQQLPVDDASMDGVCFIYSLHHIPESVYGPMFDEVFRVLRPDGFMIVIEPMNCPIFDVMRLFHNEDAELAAAQRVLVHNVGPRFVSAEISTYHGFNSYDSFDHFADVFAGKSFNSLYTAEEVRTNEVRIAFEKHGPEYRFETPKQAMFLTGIK